MKALGNAYIPAVTDDVNDSGFRKDVKIHFEVGVCLGSEYLFAGCVLENRFGHSLQDSPIGVHDLRVRGSTRSVGHFFVKTRLQDIHVVKQIMNPEISMLCRSVLEHSPEGTASANPISLPRKPEKRLLQRKNRQLKVASDLWMAVQQALQPGGSGFRGPENNERGKIS
jgi:hypothetical protein